MLDDDVRRRRHRVHAGVFLDVNFWVTGMLHDDRRPALFDPARGMTLPLPTHRNPLRLREREPGSAVFPMTFRPLVVTAREMPRALLPNVAVVGTGPGFSTGAAGGGGAAAVVVSSVVSVSFTSAGGAVVVAAATAAAVVVVSLAAGAAAASSVVAVLLQPTSATIVTNIIVRFICLSFENLRVHDRARRREIQTVSKSTGDVMSRDLAAASFLSTFPSRWQTRHTTRS